jgi:hypothetical protein
MDISATGAAVKAADKKSRRARDVEVKSGQRAKLLYMIIADHAGGKEGGRCTAKLATLAAEYQATTRATMSTLSKLKNEGLIKPIKVGRYTYYDLCIPPAIGEGSFTYPEAGKVKVDAPIGEAGRSEKVKVDAPIGEGSFTYRADKNAENDLNGQGLSDSEDARKGFRKAFKEKESVQAAKAAEREFDRFWGIYARRDGKKDALDIFTKHVVKNAVDPNVIVSGAERFIKQEKAKGTEIKYLPMAKTWLNGERWNDYAKPSKSSTVTVVYPGTKPFEAWLAYHQSAGNDFHVERMREAIDKNQPFTVAQEWPPTHEKSKASTVTAVYPGTKQFDAWLNHFESIGEDFHVRMMRDAIEWNKSYAVAQEWPPVAEAA